MPLREAMGCRSSVADCRAADNRQRTTGNWILALFVAVALLHLVPVWRVRLVPTMDGPSHLYNAVILRELAGRAPQFARVFTAHVQPTNWLGHAFLFLAILIAPPLVAEKLLVSLIVLLFLAGCWRLARLVHPDCGVYAFLAMPLAFNLLLQMGFYNDMLGVALSLHAIASWWRGRDVAGAIWLLLCAFAHALPAAAAMAFIGVAWLVTSRRWKRLLPLLSSALPLVWFFLQPAAPGGQWTWKGALLVSPLYKVLLLWTFDPRQLTFGMILAAIYGALIVLTLLFGAPASRRRDGGGPAGETPALHRHVFLLLTALAIVFYLAAPISAQEGFVLKARLLIFPYLLILPWLTPRLARLPLAIVLALAALANVVYLRDAWKRNEKVMESAIRPIAAAKPGHTFLPLLFDRSTPYSHLGFLGHAASYGAVDRRLVDLSDYEANLPFFPVAFRPTLRRPSIFEIETTPANYDAGAFADTVDYIYTWKMPPRSPLEARILQHYELVAAEGDARLYRVWALPPSAARPGAGAPTLDVSGNIARNANNK